MPRTTTTPPAQVPAVAHVQAREAATGTIGGTPFVLSPGEVLAADHEIVKAYPNFFEPLAPARQRPAVEEMTAVPGEKRGPGAALRAEQRVDAIKPPVKG